MGPMDKAWLVLKAVQTHLDVGIDEVERLRPTPPKKPVDLSRAGYYLGLSDYGDSRTYKLMHDDLSNQNLGEFRIRTKPAGDYDPSIYPEGYGAKVMMAHIDDAHRGKGLYQQALLSMLANPKYGLSNLRSDNRNVSSQRTHDNLQEHLKNLGYEDVISSRDKHWSPSTDTWNPEHFTEHRYRGITHNFNSTHQ